jgi:hypothetical protein
LPSAREIAAAPKDGMQDVSTQSAAAPSPFFPDDLQFWYETKRVFGCASYGGSEFGEVLATVFCITSGDYDSWYREWDAAGERVSNEAQRQLERGHAVSARDGFLRATARYTSRPSSRSRSRTRTPRSTASLSHASTTGSTRHSANR